jgi:predicted enzyme related to lactoylglutathione lyase
MAKALGIGGVFFKAQAPRDLAEWYARWLEIRLDPSFCGACFHPASLPEGAYTVWSPFDATTTYFDPSDRPFMINLVVDDVDGALAQVAQGGGSPVGEPQTEEFGRFGWFVDPEGNKVELWQPPAPDTE